MAGIYEERYYAINTTGDRVVSGTIPCSKLPTNVYAVMYLCILSIAAT